MAQNALTAIIPIKPNEVESLRAFLEPIGNDIQHNPDLGWADSPSTHFARFVILDPIASPGVYSLKGRPARLLFTSNHDGSFEFYMRELVETFGARMNPIWSKCQGFPVGGAQDVTAFTNFIRRHSLQSEAFYIGVRGVAVQTIRDGIRIRDALTKLLDETTPASPLGQLAAQLPLLPNPALPQSGPSSTFFSDLIEWVVGVRPGENPNLPVDSPPAQVEVEDRVVQNQMTVIVPITPSPKARWLVRIILWAVNQKAQRANGSLAGLTTIHFARWAIIDDGANLLFESNFDGSWENYIDDFVDFASLGMNAIWANCIGFPRGGCKDIEWFKKYIRDNQIPAQVFYSAYPSSTICNNLNDLQIKRAVERFLPAGEIEPFLNGAANLSDPVVKSAVEQLLRAEEINLFLDGSYNRGVARALRTPIEPDPINVPGAAAGSTSGSSAAAGSAAESTASRSPLSGALAGGKKIPVLMAVLAVGGWLLWRRRR